MKDKIIALVKKHGRDVPRLLIELGGTMSHRNITSTLQRLRRDMRKNPNIRDDEFLAKLEEVHASDDGGLVESEDEDLQLNIETLEDPLLL